MSSTTPDPNDTPKVILGAIAAFLLAVSIATILWAVFKDSLNW